MTIKDSVTIDRETAADLIEICDEYINQTLRRGGIASKHVAVARKRRDNLLDGLNINSDAKASQIGGFASSVPDSGLET